MKPFQLDIESINDAIESWPAILLALAASGLLLYFGCFDAVWRAMLIAFAAMYFGYTLRGTLNSSLRSKYPNATCIWLISIGLTSAALGVIARMLMPSLQGGFTDLVWVVLWFATILAFVVVNRHDPDVLK